MPRLPRQRFRLPMAAQLPRRRPALQRGPADSHSVRRRPHLQQPARALPLQPRVDSLSEQPARPAIRLQRSEVLPARHRALLGPRPALQRGPADSHSVRRRPHLRLALAPLAPLHPHHSERRRQPHPPRPSPLGPRLLQEAGSTRAAPRSRADGDAGRAKALGGDNGSFVYEYSQHGPFTLCAPCLAALGTCCCALGIVRRKRTPDR